jgi:membrane fusion protein (multidrug efflux system)
MRPSYNAPEAPTHLRAGDLPPGLLDHLDQIDPGRLDRCSGAKSVSQHSASASASRTRQRAESAEPAALPAIPHIPDADDHSIVSVSRSRSHYSASALSAAPRFRTEPASAAATPAPRRQRPQATPAPQLRATPAPQPVHGTATPRMRPAQSVHAAAAAAAAAQSARSSASSSRSRSSEARSSSPSVSVAALPPPPAAPPPVAPPTAAPAPGLPPGVPPAVAAAAAAAALGAIDPMAVPTPPELAGTIYSHIRRLALQADLPGADRVMRDALAELTSSLSCTIVYPGQDGLWTLGDDDEVPRDPQPLIAVATARRAVIASHVAMIPVITSAETVAVITLNRNPRQPAFQPIEQIAMVALSREAAPILHHLAVQHLQRASEIKADKGSLYRGEALEHHRTRGQEGELVQLSPGWVKRAYPLLVITIIAAAAFATFVKVPTYSTGTAVIMFEGSTSVTATMGGTVEKVFVKDNEAVKKGDPLIRVGSPEAVAQLAAAETDWHDQQIQFLFDQTDEQSRKALKSAATQRDRALAMVEAHTIRAPRDGVITNLHIKEGAALNLGGYAMQITDENSEIEVLAFLPSKDSPRIRTKMPLQLELDGYKKARAIGTITQVQPDAISGAEAAKLGGDMLAESIAKDLQAGTTWFTARARLPSRTFRTEHNTYHYHHGMHSTVEVKVQSKPFLATLLPAIEKWLPE